MAKTVLITGATSGIGFACVRVFAKRGWRILGTGRSQQSLEKGKKEALENGAPSAEFFAVDFSAPGAVLKFFRENQSRIREIDALVNNAGIAYPGGIQEISEEQWEEVYRVNVTAAFMMIQQALPFLEKSKGGAIVNVSSIAGRLRSLSLGAHYSSSKAALIGMTRQLAVELGKKGIRINCVCPSQTETPMLDAALTSEQKRKLSESIPLGRVARAEEQAQVIQFLCSDEASYVHGSILDVNGGLL